MRRAQGVTWCFLPLPNLRVCGHKPLRAPYLKPKGAASVAAMAISPEFSSSRTVRQRTSCYMPPARGADGQIRPRRLKDRRFTAPVFAFLERVRIAERRRFTHLVKYRPALRSTTLSGPSRDTPVENSDPWRVSLGALDSLQRRSERLTEAGLRFSQEVTRSVRRASSSSGVSSRHPGIAGVGADANEIICRRNMVILVGGRLDPSAAEIVA